MSTLSIFVSSFDSSLQACGGKVRLAADRVHALNMIMWCYGDPSHSGIRFQLACWLDIYIVPTRSLLETGALKTEGGEIVVKWGCVYTQKDRDRHVQKNSPVPTILRRGTEKHRKASAFLLKNTEATIVCGVSGRAQTCSNCAHSVL